MSGLAAVLRRDRAPADRDTLARMTATLAARGPDGGGVWADGPVGLGHRALAASDAAFDTEPMPLVRGEVALTADLRLDNREPLIRTLDTPADASDGALVLAAYERWGEACPEHLLGSFAFALWDGRRRTLLCARDPLGTRPLVIARTPNALVVASAPRAILASGALAPRLDDGRIADFLIGTTEHLDHTSTFFHGIEKLPPGTVLMASAEGERRRRFWRAEDAPEVRFRSDEEAVEAFAETFADAVRVRLRGATGSALSGGIDSSAIVAEAAGHLAEVGRGPLPTISAVQAAPCRETDAVRAVLGGVPGLDPTLFTPADLGRYAEPLDVLVADLDDLFDATMAELRYVTVRAARDLGVRAVLDGCDGDVLLGTTLPVVGAHVRAGRIGQALAEARGYAAVYPEQGTASRRLWREGLRPLLASAVPDALRGRTRVPDLSASFIRPEFAASVDVGERIARRAATLTSLPGASLRERHARLLGSPLLTVGVERYDRVAARQGIEARHPLLDRRLVELSIALPESLKVRRGVSKVALRRAMQGRVPESVRTRRSWDALLGPLFFGPWIDANREMLGHALADPASEVGRFVDVAAVQAALGRLAPGGHPPQGLWEALVLALWPPIRSGTFPFAEVAPG